jgi:hypothetical protein
VREHEVKEHFPGGMGGFALEREPEASHDCSRGRVFGLVDADERLEPEFLDAHSEPRLARLRSRSRDLDVARRASIRLQREEPHFGSNVGMDKPAQPARSPVSATMTADTATLGRVIASDPAGRSATRSKANARPVIGSTPATAWCNTKRSLDARLTEMGTLLVITAPPGAGKSTAARFVADAAERSVLVEGDAFFGFLASGAIEPWLPESNEQNEVVTQAAASAAGRFAKGGFTVIYDGVVGPWFLPTFAAATGLDDLEYVVFPVLDVVQRAGGAVDVYRHRGWRDVGEARPAWLPDGEPPVLLMILPSSARVLRP